MKAKIMILTGLLTLLIGCSPKIPESKDITIQTSEIYGENADLISIIPKTYTLKKRDNGLCITVQLKLEKSTKNRIDCYPELILKDEDDIDVVSGWNQMKLNDKAKFQNFINSEVGTIMDFAFINEFGSSEFYKVMTSSQKFALNGLRLEQPVSNTSQDIVNDIVNNIDTDNLENAIDTYEKALDATEKAMEVLENLNY